MVPPQQRLCSIPARAPTRLLAVLIVVGTGRALAWGDDLFRKATAAGGDGDVAGDLSKGLHQHLDKFVALVDAEATLREAEWLSFAEDVGRVLSRLELGGISDTDDDDTNEEDTNAITDGWQDVSESSLPMDDTMEDADGGVFVWESPPTKSREPTTRTPWKLRTIAELKKDRTETASAKVRTFAPSPAGCVEEHCVDKLSEPIFGTLEQLVDACGKDKQCVYVDYNSFLHYGHLCFSAKLISTTCIERPIWQAYPQALTWHLLGPADGYVARDQGLNHGKPLGQLTLGQCTSRCEATPECGSLSYCPGQSKCMLKDKKIRGHEPTKFLGGCSTYFQAEEKKAAAAATAEEGGVTDSDAVASHDGVDPADRFAAMLLSRTAQASEDAAAIHGLENGDRASADSVNHGGDLFRKLAETLADHSLGQSTDQTSEQPSADAVQEETTADVSDIANESKSNEEKLQRERLGDESDISSEGALGDVLGEAFGDAPDDAMGEAIYSLDTAVGSVLAAVPDTSLDNAPADASEVSLGDALSNTVEAAEQSIAEVALAKL